MLLLFVDSLYTIIAVSPIFRLSAYVKVLILIYNFQALYGPFENIVKMQLSLSYVVILFVLFTLFWAWLGLITFKDIPEAQGYFDTFGYSINTMWETWLEVIFIVLFVVFSQFLCLISFSFSLPKIKE